MTHVAKRKTRLQFETSDTFQHHAVVVEVDPFFATVRLKGKRTRFQIPWGAVYTAAAKLEAARIRAEKLTKRR